jgi:hypothetical protein
MRTVIFLVFLFSVSPVWSDLDQFVEDIERTEEISEQEEDTHSSPDSDPYDSSESESENAFVRLLFEIWGYLWLANNLGTAYEPYPYYEQGYYHWLPDFEVPDGSPLKDQYFNLSVHGISFEELGYGTWLTFEGHLFRFFGPYLEAFVLSDGNKEFYGQRYGLNFSLFQSDPLSMSLYWQFTQWTGIFFRSGQTVGVELKSFPFEPLVLKFRGGGQYFNSFNMGEVEVEGGIMLERFALTGGWRWWNLGTKTGLVTNFYNGPYAGLEVYF